MPMFKTCTACKETFIAESPFIKLCPICNAKSQTTPAERAQCKTRITPDRLIHNNKFVLLFVGGHGIISFSFS